ncbi:MULTISPECIES: hypothetical protein [unclassified Bradyrhizobium]|uniref:hypothetical protein n=1 Tax=unclassified Bradyrhizobium TaxID=2631580 RepID=UPI0028E9BC1D|nr:MULTISPECIES: hypothetical protein [unclassified Bradyrhizobium]
MTWKEERDALIAQTMAFVQSVTGKPADFSQFELPAVPAVTPAQQTAFARGGTAPPEIASPTVADRPRAPAMPETAVAGAGPVAPERFTSIASQLDLQRDMQAEIRARVARFRAHQERFNRERQEYFSATLARLKASAEGTVLPED